MPVCFCRANAPETMYGTCFSFNRRSTSRNSFSCSGANFGGVDELTGGALFSTVITRGWMAACFPALLLDAQKREQWCTSRFRTWTYPFRTASSSINTTMARQVSNVEIEGRQLSLSNLNKVLYPEANSTKAQVIDYFVRIAPVLLPHLKGRPLTMKRYPEGVNGMHFYEKNCPSHRPEWVQTAPIWSEGNNRWMHYCLIEDLPTLVWAANLADLELHTSLSLAKEILKPTMVVFDLDPGPPADIVLCCQVG